MVGGGIFSTLGVVIGIAGAWAWLSFLAAGLVAFCTAYSYSKLAESSGLSPVIGPRPAVMGDARPSEARSCTTAFLRL